MKLRRGIVFGLTAAMALSLTAWRRKDGEHKGRKRKGREREHGRRYIRGKEQLLDCDDHRYGRNQ